MPRDEIGDHCGSPEADPCQALTVSVARKAEAAEGVNGMSDYRLKVGFFRHHKTLRLHRRLGAEGVLSLLRLWEYAAEFRPTGDLSGMSPEDIEAAAGWESDEDSLTSALIDIGFIDESETGASLHDWALHNPWVSSTSQRSDAARLSRLAREDKDAAEAFRNAGKRGISEQEYREAKKNRIYEHSSVRSTTVNVRSTPAPAPAPAPTPKDVEEISKKTLVTSVDSPNKPSEKSGKGYSETFEKFWSVFPRRTNKVGAYAAWCRTRDGQYGAPPQDEDMISAAKRYGDGCRAEGREERFMMHPSTFLGPNRRWEDFLPGVKRSATGAGVAEPSDREAFARERHEKEVLFGGDQRRWWQWIQAGRPDPERWKRDNP